MPSPYRLDRVAESLGVALIDPLCNEPDRPINDVLLDILAKCPPEMEIKRDVTVAGEVVWIGTDFRTAECWRTSGDLHDCILNLAERYLESKTT